MKTDKKTSEELLVEIDALNRRIAGLEAENHALKSGPNLKTELPIAGDEMAKAMAIIEAMGDGISVQATDFRILYQNRRQKELVGSHPGEYCYKAYQGRDSVCEGCHLAMSFKDGLVHKREASRTSDSGVLYYEITASPVKNSEGKIIAGIEAVRDVTVRMESLKALQETAAALRQSEERYRLLFQNSPVGIFQYDTDLRITDCNERFVEILKSTKELVIGLDMKTLNDKSVLPAVYSAIEGEEGDYEGLYRATTGPAEVWVLMKTAPFFGPEGNVQGGVGIVEDITRRKYLENAVFQINRDWEDTFNTITDMITVHDKDFNIIRANKAAEKILGLPFLQDQQAKCYEYYHGKGCPPEGCPSCLSLKTGMPAVSEIFEPHLKMFIEIRAIPRFDSSDRLAGLIHVGRDMTEHKRLEEQLRQSQKMEGIGQLAGGIAHDFANILNAVMGFGGLLRMKMEPSDPRTHYIDELVAAGERGASLTHQLLALSRKQVLDMKTINLNDIIKSLEKLLLRLIREDVKLVFKPSEDALNVMADGSQIDQVLINLATNARDAMPHGGDLTLSTSSMDMDEEFVKMHGFGVPGKYALISVTDTGSGIDENARERIFEPFFTTKEIGKGTGLGLAVVYGIVKQHNGFINVYSEPGRGTTFRIYLPLVDSMSPVTAQKERPKPRGGKETIIVADDDSVLRQLSKTVLESFGYTVITAEDGEDVVRKFMENRGSVRLLVLDMIMPNKGGKAAYEEISKIAPDIKVLFLSGYTGDTFHMKDLANEKMSFLSKPVSASAFLEKVRETLDK